MKTERIIIIILALALMLVLGVQLGRAETQTPQDETSPQAPEGDLNDQIPIQGYLTDASGNPLNGTYSITAYVYDAATGGSLICGSWIPSISVVKGLFNQTIDLCDAADAFQGDQLYLALQVGSDPEMTPRQPILAVPYAYNVKRGAVIQGANSYLFVPGTAIVKDQSSDTTTWDMYLGGAKIKKGSATVGTAYVRLPVTLPAVLYGQAAKVTSMTVYYQCEDGTANYISDTKLSKNTDADSAVYLINDATNRTSSSATSYSLNTDSSFNTLSSSQGILVATIGIYFNDNTHYVLLSGIQLTLDHTY